MAAPSMLMVLPSGMEKLETDLEAPSFCTDSRLEERAAAEEQVAGLSLTFPAGTSFSGEDARITMLTKEGESEIARPEQ